MMKLLVISAGIFHPPMLGRRALEGLLQETGASSRFGASLEVLPCSDLSGIDVLVLYFHKKQISQAALQALDLFVSRGGGVLAIHSATASFKQDPHYYKILGGRFAGHAPLAPFTVQPVEGSLLAKTSAAFSVRDELYLHDLQPGVSVHFVAEHAGENVPVVWTLPYGEGRVCYACPGHTSQTMRNPAYQNILRNGLDWAASRQGFAPLERRE
jgi:type 1 glutamine amidotransferase